MPLTEVSERQAAIRLPAPNLAVTENATPYSHARAQKMGKGRTFYDVAVVRGTFDLGRGKLTRAKRQGAVVLSDRYHDEEDASRSSLALPGDLIVGKVTTDVIVTGTARAPGLTPIPRWQCGVSVRRMGRTLLDANMIATGPRLYVHRPLRGFRLSEPEPTLEVPIRYELAYGGSYPNPKPTDELPFLVDEANPSGRGFLDETKLDTRNTYPGPQWETPASPALAVNTPSALAGFGPVARMWSARTAFGGTYDAAWEARFHRDVENHIPPDYPEDFDLRFFQCAHPALVSSGWLDGGDLVTLKGLAAEAELSFSLPKRPSAELFARGAPKTYEPLALDLVHVDLDAQTVSLSWRVSIQQARQVYAMRITTSEE